MEESPKSDKTVLANHLGGGPHGIGDPDDKSLRKAEVEILIPQKMKAKAKKERCAEEIKGFGICAKEQGFMLPFNCRNEGQLMKECLEKAYTDQAFQEQCKQEYLRERSEYRRTGIRAKEQKKESAF